MSTHTPHVLARTELRKFDDEALAVIREFQQHGWRGYVSQRGHAIMRAPDGETTASISHRLGGKAGPARKARGDLARWLRTQDTTKGTDVAVMEAVPETAESTGVPCPECGQVIQSKALGAHIGAVHRGPYPCPECGRAFETIYGLPTHRKGHAVDRRNAELVAWVSLNAPVTAAMAAAAMGGGLTRSTVANILLEASRAGRLQVVPPPSWAPRYGAGKGRPPSWYAVPGVEQTHALKPAWEPAAEPTPVVEEPAATVVVDEPAAPARPPAALPSPTVNGDPTATLDAIRALVGGPLLEEVERLRAENVDLRAALADQRARADLAREALGL